MNKYGIENFIIEELEQVKDENLLSEREIYWIKELELMVLMGTMPLKEEMALFSMIIKKLFS